MRVLAMVGVYTAPLVIALNELGFFFVTTLVCYTCQREAWLAVSLHNVVNAMFCIVAVEALPVGEQNARG